MKVLNCKYQRDKDHIKIFTEDLFAMKDVIVKIISIDLITHDVLQISAEKPDNLSFIPGQATEVSINKAGWQNQRRPFTFTSLPDDDQLQFTIKTYPARHGVTNELLKLKRNDELILNDVFGTIAYKSEGVFIAGGAGITPFISILRFLKARNETGNNLLIFANKTKNDIILKDEFSDLLGKNFINILSEEKVRGYSHGFITENFLTRHITDFSRNFYLCGPPPMMRSVEKILSDLKVDKNLIIREEF
jgi:ferredoxin-NADP reductase